VEARNRLIAEGSLFMTLIIARDRLRQLLEENHKQTWITHGLAEFGDTLSAGNTDLKDLCDTVMSQLVTYIKGNQGGLFILKEKQEDADTDPQKYLELLSCYGYNQQQGKERKILLSDDFSGGGLIGQALIEKGAIHQVGVSEAYFNVAMGTGDVPNGNVLIVPLISNQIEIGVLEIGSFQEFESHEIEFVESLADRIASTILNIQASVKTSFLLMEAEEQKDMLQAQEEEMRQNVEELRAIHEVMGKKQKELELQNQRTKSSELVLKKALKQLEEQKIELEETNEILHAQEEEMRQNVEELISTQEALALKTKNLEHQNKFITTSIYYAQNIQQAILPTREKMLSLLKGGFVIYRPKDIVSGDFYWLSQVKEKTVVAAVDCTGHGVPGAFMSMIGNTLLNQIINEKKTTDPAEILRSLDKGIYEDLNQQKTSNREGMDVCLCVIEYVDNKAHVLYGGAKRGLYYYHQDTLQELKGDRFSIGGWQSYKEKSFVTKELTLDINDRLYLSSDGLVDTPNPKRKSFGTKRLKHALQSSANLSINEQQTLIENTLNEFQQDAEQRDDILLIGIDL
jgi:serine phosphatase RsbU (regulator of sigma subunit)